MKTDSLKKFSYSFKSFSNIVIRLNEPTKYLLGIGNFIELYSYTILKLKKNLITKYQDNVFVFKKTLII